MVPQPGERLQRSVVNHILLIPVAWRVECKLHCQQDLRMLYHDYPFPICTYNPNIFEELASSKPSSPHEVDHLFQDFWVKKTNECVFDLNPTRVTESYWSRENRKMRQANIEESTLAMNQLSTAGQVAMRCTWKLRGSSIIINLKVEFLLTSGRGLAMQHSGLQPCEWQRGRWVGLSQDQLAYARRCDNGTSRVQHDQSQSGWWFQYLQLQKSSYVGLVLWQIPKIESRTSRRMGLIRLVLGELIDLTSQKFP